MKESQMLTLSVLVRTAKRYALDSSMTDEDFLNALLEPYVQSGRVKGRGGVEYHLDAPRTSRLLNGKADVPKALKKPLRRFGLEEDVAKNAGIFLDDCIDIKDEARFEEDLLGALEANDGPEAELRLKMQGLKGDANRFFACALIESLKASNVAMSEHMLWQNGTGALAVEVGDLFSKGFGRKKARKNIVAIPVDSRFDTVVSWNAEQSEHPHVSASSVHGMWLRRMYQCGETSRSLEERISQSLALRQKTPISDIGTPRYPIGTVAVLESEKALFFLLATSDFDSSNTAHSSPDLIRAAQMALIDEYDATGQGLDLYLPLMGTGLSRAGLSHQESYELTVGTLTERKHDIHGRVTLMVCPDDVAQLDQPLSL